MNTPTLQASVIVCTHNPRADYLRRTLQALQAQTLPAEQWELLLIDNASAESVAGRVDLGWHPHGRCVREELLGLTPARLRGIAETRADLIVFVDDDNVLDPGYLRAALDVAKEHPHIGVFGGGARPGFEEPPPEWTRRYWIMLAIREPERDLWSNLYLYETAPCGAGMCVRRAVAARYQAAAASDPARSTLDRRGRNLISCGDSDIAFTACDLGMGIGIFTALWLTHLMPKQRLEETYLRRLAESLEYSKVLLGRLRGGPVSQPRPSPLRRAAQAARALLTLSPRERRMQQAGPRGRQRAFDDIARGA